MSLTTAAIGRPVTTSMVFVCLLVIGVISSRLIPMEYFPAMDAPMLGVDIPYPGSTPEEVERQITRPAEEVLATLRGLKDLNSWSNENGAFIQLEFDWGEDTKIRALEVREKLDGINDDFPSDVERVFVRQHSTSDWPILNLRISSERNLSGAYELLDRKIKRRLERLDGVSKVDLDGVVAKEVSVELMADRVAAHQVDLVSLVQRLQESNFSLTAGRITDAGKRFNVRPVGELRTVDEVRDLVVGSGGLRLRDIAEVKFAPPEMRYGRHLDGAFAVGITVFKEAGANTVAVAESIVDELDGIESDPEMQGIQLYYMNNVADGIVQSLRDLLQSGLIGAFFAIIVLLFFLRHITTTLVVALAVPISLMVSVGALYFIGYTLNVLTMMGLMLAIGMLVDNAVVVTESIHRHRVLDSTDAVGATLRGVKEVGMAVTAGTLTTAIVFLPMIVSPADEITVYLKHVSVTICLALAASLVLALTVVPLFTARLKPVDFKNRKANIIDKLVDRYGVILSWLIRHPRSAGLLVLLVLASVAIPAGKVDMDFFPNNNTNREFRLHYHIAGSYTLDRVEEAVNKVEDYLLPRKEELEIQSVYSFYESGYAMSTITLKEGKEAKRTVTDIQEQIRKELPKLVIANPSFEWRSSGGQDGIRITLTGESSELLADLSKDVATVLARVPGLADVRSEVEMGDEEVLVVVDRLRARQYGFSSEQVARSVTVAMRGQNLRRFRTAEGEVEMQLRFQDSDRRSLDDLRNLPIYGPQDRPVKLASLAHLNVRRGPQSIRREERRTMMGITAHTDGIPDAEAREKITQVLNRYQLPAGYAWSFGQSWQGEQESQNIMLMNLLLALALIYLVMAALFESLIYPAAIWSSIIFAVVGVFWFFFATGTAFSVMAWIGVLILIGVVVNNGIVLIDHINYLRASGLSRTEAIVQGGRDRLRPILMTALTTILGLIPLCIGTTQIGGDGPPYYPMARAIVGGLAFSTIVTLIMLPTIYVVLDDLRNWGRRTVRASTMQ